MQKSLTEQLNEIVTAAHEAFPEELKNLVVLPFLPVSEISSKTPIFVASEVAKHLAQNPIVLKKAIEERTKFLEAKNASGVSNSSYFLGGVKVKVIALNENPIGTFSNQYTKEMNKIDVPIHEIGHLIFRNKNTAPPLSNFSECLADVYASFNHIQTFGNKTGFFEYYGNMAHVIVLHGSSMHYTNDVMEQVKQLSEEIDISSLSPQATANLTEKIVSKYRLSPETLETIRVAFIPVKEAYKKTGKSNGETVLKECIKVMQRYPENPNIFMAGKRFLSHPKIMEMIENKAKTDSYWKDALDFIKNHQIKPVQKIPLQQHSNIAMKVY